MDGALLRRFRSGDRDALAQVYRTHFDEVERFIRRGLLAMGLFSPANLADVIQDVFLKAFAPAARSRYDAERGPYAPFLMTLSRNVLVDWARRHGREARVDGHAAVEDAVGGEAAGAPSMFEPSLVAATKRYVEKLSPELRALHHRRFVLAEPQRQAAERLGITRQNLRTLERRLVEGLRQHLESDDAATDAPLGVINAPRR
jgi:RNA polymerase sigma factor (sigma-70 family)